MHKPKHIKTKGHTSMEEDKQSTPQPGQAAPTPFLASPASPVAATPLTSPVPRAWWRRPRMLGAGIAAVVLVIGGYLLVHSLRATQTAVKLPPTYYVSITAQGFSPQSITVAPGTDVVWVDKDPAPHLPAADPFPSHSSLPSLVAPRALGQGQSYNFHFTQAGTYHYHDDLHPMLSGEVVVQ